VGPTAAEVALDGLTRRFETTTYFACEAGPAEPNEPERGTALGLDMLVTSKGNRWSADGEPTVYLAGDVGVALAELGRHTPAGPVGRAGIWSIDVRLDAVLDLRLPAVRRALGLPHGASWPLDRHRCLDLARTLRARVDVDGLIVPSVATLDQPERWNAVVFAERLRTRLDEALRPGPLVMAIGSG
jgi:RES domain-containing protein